MASQVVTDAYLPHGGVLQNQDLVNIIVHYIWDETWSTRYQNLSCTLVSKCFWEASSRCCWAQLSSLQPLLKLLPQMNKQKKILIRPLQSGDLARWRIYAPLVKDIEVSVEETEDLRPAIAILASFQAGTGEVLLPALRSLLFFRGVGESTLVFWEAVKASPIQEIVFERPFGASPDFINYLGVLLQRAACDTPRLSSLELPDWTAPANIWGSLSPLKQLRNLVLCGAPEPIEKLLCLVGLEEGEVTSSHDGAMIEIRKDRLVGKTIHMRAPLIRLLSWLPIAARHHEFATLEVEYSEKRGGEEWCQLLTAISTSCSRISALLLEVPTTLELGAVCQVVKSLPMLEDLTMRARWALDQVAGDEFFKGIGQSDRSTLLLKLEISGEGYHVVTGQFTFSIASLQDARQYLPYLRELSLPIDSSLPFETDSSKYPMSQGHHPLLKLCVRDARQSAFGLAEPRQIARFIFHLFPDLLTIQGMSSSLEPHNVWEGWEVVQQCIADYRDLLSS